MPPKVGGIVGVYERSPVKGFVQPVSVQVESPKRAKWDRRHPCSIERAVGLHDPAPVTHVSVALPMVEAVGRHPPVEPKDGTPTKRLLFGRTAERAAWEEESRVLAKKMAQQALKTSEKRRFIVGSALAPSFERLCHIVQRSGVKAHRVRGAKRPGPAEHLTYGEGDLDAFVTVFKRLGLKRGQRFLDLGAGKGHVCLLAGLFGAESVGIELMDDLYEASMDLLDEYDETVSPLWVEPGGPGDGPLHAIADQQRTPHVMLQLGDMFSISWAGYDVIYACSTCFGSAMCKRVGAKAQAEISPECVVLSVSRPLHDLHLVGEMPCQFTWGQDTLYLHRKKTSMEDSSAAAVDLLDLARDRIGQ
jgi:hypothetical protein